jgi:hypothetical protein
MAENKKEDIDVIIFTSKYSTLNLQSRSFSIFGGYNYMYIHDFHELFNKIDETLKSKRFVTVAKDKQTLIETRKSSGTYTVCGDCIVEEQLYSEGQREDITFLVTHWMPIPELPKGE